MEQYQCETCGTTVEIEPYEAAFGNHEHYENGQCMPCFNKAVAEG